MGNDVSAGTKRAGNTLQSQDSDLLWTITHYEEEDSELEEEVCAFTHVPGNGAKAEFCRLGVEHLRLLRHPNILKFVSCEVSRDRVAIVTEPIVPLCKGVDEVCVEGLVIGWRGVGEALQFLHERARISHNNLSSDCVYISTVTSQWKIGGFEAAQQPGKIDTLFLAKIAPIRHAKAIPPEDKGGSTMGRVSTIPCHSRDVWAYGGLILATLEMSKLESRVSDSIFGYVHENMLNVDPQLRPVASDVLQQAWMSTGATEIFDFLNKLTMKSKREKDEFFSSLAGHLHSLPPAMVAEHIVPLLLTPLVMAEPLAREKLWKHLLLPACSAIPRQEHFDPNSISPILEKELYISHVIPVLLNLLESRDIHVRLVLLENIKGFAPIIEKEELLEEVLPEVLIGLKEMNDTVVQATLHALADLIPLLGAEVVIGTHRKHIFADAKPRTENGPTMALPQTKMPLLTSVSPSSTPVGGQGSTGGADRQERLDRMREKREEQRRKRMSQENKKLGGRMVLGRGGVFETAVSTEDVGTRSDETTPTTSNPPQYSPSRSHDEKDHWEATETGLTSNETGETRTVFTESRESEGEEWEDFESSWMDEKLNLPTGQDQSSLEVGTTDLQSGEQSPGSSSSLGHSRGSGKSNGVSENDRELDKSIRGRLKADDIQRLEVQAAWRKTEPDFFADMEPSIAVGVGVKGQGSDDQRPASAETSPLSLKYTPSAQAEDEEPRGWAEDWSDFDNTETS